MPDEFEKIRTAVLANRGGLGEATDVQIITIWDSLDAVTQQEYLKAQGGKKGGKPDAGGAGPKTDV